jgi:hypothetical protein
MQFKILIPKVLVESDNLMDLLGSFLLHGGSEVSKLSIQIFWEICMRDLGGVSYLFSDN